MPDKKCSTCTRQPVCGHWRDYLNASRSDTRLLCGHLLPEWRGDMTPLLDAKDAERRRLMDLVSERCHISLPCLCEMTLTDMAEALVNQALAARVEE